MAVSAAVGRVQDSRSLSSLHTSAFSFASCSRSSMSGNCCCAKRLMAGIHCLTSMIFPIRVRSLPFLLASGKGSKGFHTGGHGTLVRLQRRRVTGCCFLIFVCRSGSLRCTTWFFSLRLLAGGLRLGLRSSCLLFIVCCLLCVT